MNNRTRIAIALGAVAVVIIAIVVISSGDDDPPIAASTTTSDASTVTTGSQPGDPTTTTATEPAATTTTEPGASTTTTAAGETTTTQGGTTTTTTQGGTTTTTQGGTTTTTGQTTSTTRAATTTTTTRPELPANVAATAAAIVAAAESEDLDALDDLTGPFFAYTAGPDHPDGPVGYWQDRIGEGVDVFGIMAAVFSLDPVDEEETGQLLVFPYHAAREFSSLNAAELADLELLGGPSVYEDETYFGWVGAIRADTGEWFFYLDGQE